MAVSMILIKMITEFLFLHRSRPLPSPEDIADVREMFIPPTAPIPFFMRSLQREAVCEVSINTVSQL